MDERDQTYQPGAMSWKAFVVRLIEAVRWPIAFTVIVYLLREPLTALLHRLTS